MLAPGPKTGLLEIVEMEDMKEVVIKKKAPFPMLWLKVLGLVGGRALLSIFGRVPSLISNVYVAQSSLQDHQPFPMPLRCGLHRTVITTLCRS
jgi:hypothetical protein